MVMMNFHHDENEEIKKYYLLFFVFFCCCFGNGRYNEYEYTMQPPRHICIYIDMYKQVPLMERVEHQLYRYNNLEADCKREIVIKFIIANCI